MCNVTVCASMQVGTAEAVLQTSAKVCSLRQFGLFRIFVKANTGTTQPVSIGFCNGGTFPVFLQSTGAQATAATFVEGVTYLISYDCCSKKFFVVGF